MMIEHNKQHELDIRKWCNIEKQMTELYTDPNRIAPETFEEDEYDERIYRVPSTG